MRGETPQPNHPTIFAHAKRNHTLRCFGLSPRRTRHATRKPAIALAAALLLLLGWCFGGSDQQVWPREAILTALRMVESSGQLTPTDGDGGLAIGPYQIHELYWRDAVRFRPELGGTYQDCRDRAYAEAVIDAYMRKWAADAWEKGYAERIARIHNGGPLGAKKSATNEYWRRVRERLP